MIIGTETEYGVWAPEAPDADPAWLSRLVVDAYDGVATPANEAASRWLANGARLYVDHAHPEYATPECASPRDAAAAELAGDRLVADAAARASQRAGVRVQVFKNNTDGKGQAYGYHENVQIARATPWERVEAHLPTFLVTRTVLFGAGRLGLGASSESPGFQLSPRADFFERVSGLDTTRNRGLVNTRDEPHALRDRYRRLHVITADGNRNPFATWLRLGSLALYLAGLEAGVLPAIRLADPVGAFRAVSRDLSLATPLALVGGGAASALEVQRRLLDAVAPLAGAVADGEPIIREWVRALDDLGRDPASTADRLDWPARLALLDAARRRYACGWDDPRLLRLDLAWSELSDASPWARLRAAGRFAEWIDDASVARAMTEPPGDTRASTRGRLIAADPDAVAAVNWDAVLLHERGRLRTVRLDEPGASEPQTGPQPPTHEEQR